jgi:hypothetical protein
MRLYNDDTYYILNQIKKNKENKNINNKNSRHILVILKSNTKYYKQKQDDQQIKLVKLTFKMQPWYNV